MKEHGSMPMKMVECDCGFMVRTGRDDELVKMVQMHSMDTHKMQASRGDVMKMAKPANM